MKNNSTLNILTYPKCATHNEIPIERAFSAPFSPKDPVKSLNDSRAEYVKYIEAFKISTQEDFPIDEDLIRMNTCHTIRDLNVGVHDFCNICKYHEGSYESVLNLEFQILLYFYKSKHKSELLKLIDESIFNYYYIEHQNGQYYKVHITKQLFNNIKEESDSETLLTILRGQKDEVEKYSPDLTMFINQIIEEDFNSNNRKISDRIKTAIKSVKSSKLKILDNDIEEVNSIMHSVNNSQFKSRENKIINDKKEDIYNAQPIIFSDKQVKEKVDLKKETNKKIYNQEISKQNSIIEIESVPTKSSSNKDMHYETNNSIDVLYEMTKDPSNLINDNKEAINNIDNIYEQFKEKEQQTPIIKDKKDDFKNSNNIASPTVLPETDKLSEFKEFNTISEVSFFSKQLASKEIYIKTKNLIEILVMNNNGIPSKYTLDPNQDLSLYLIDMLVNNIDITKFVDDLSYFKGKIDIVETRSIYDLKVISHLLNNNKNEIYETISRKIIENMSKENRKTLKMHTSLKIIDIFNRVNHSNLSIEGVPGEINADEVLLNAIDNNLFNKFSLKFVKSEKGIFEFFVPHQQKEVADRLIFLIEEIKYARKIRCSMEVKIKNADINR